MTGKTPDWVKEEKARREDQAARREAYDKWARQQAEEIRGMIAARERKS